MLIIHISVLYCRFCRLDFVRFSPVHHFPNNDHVKSFFKVECVRDSASDNSLLDEFNVVFKFNKEAMWS